MKSGIAPLLSCCLLAAVAVPSAAVDPARPDVVLITIDTLRADSVGFAGNPRVATPALDLLAAQGRVFTNAHAHNVVTLPSHTNILTGLYPFQHGVRDNEGFRLPPTVPTLATWLSEAGYATAAVVGAFPLDSEFGLARGFDLYDDRVPKGSRPREFVMAERTGAEVVTLGRAWWAAHPTQPRFLWLHLYDPHAGYLPPEPFKTRYAKEPYLGEVAAVDSYLRPLLEEFTGGKARPALVIVTSDHGESLGEHGELTHGLFAYEATLRVPLVLWGTGVKLGRDDRPAAHVDLVPTVLDLLRLDPPSPPGMRRSGSSLLREAAPTLAAEPRYFEALSTTLNRGWAPLRGFLQSGRKYISLPIAELYDLAKDPREIDNLYGREKVAADAVLNRLPRESTWPPEQQIESEETSKALMALGYLGGGGSGGARKATYLPDDDPKSLIDLDRKIQTLIDAYQSRRLDVAVKLGAEIVAERPQMPLGHSLYAQALLESGQQDKAIELMLAARRGNVATEPLLRQLGLSLASAARYPEALEVLRPMTSNGVPANRNAYAGVLSEAGRQDEAEKELRALLADDAEEPKAREQMALVQLRRSRFADAKNWAEQALRVNAELPLAWNYLGVAEAQLGRPTAAVAAWQKAVELDPELWDALWNLGTTAAELGLKEQAAAALRGFAERAPKSQYGRDIERAKEMLNRLGVVR